MNPTRATFSARPARGPSARLMRSLGMALLGAVVGAGAATVLVDRGSALRWADVLAIGCALVCLLGGLVLTLTSLDPRALSRAMNVEGEATRREVRSARANGALLQLTGALLLAPIAASALGLRPDLAWFGLLAAFALQSGWNWRLWRTGDELTRRLIVECGAAAFWVFQVGLFLFAAAARLGLAPGADAWDIFSVLMATYLVAASVISLRLNIA